MVNRNKGVFAGLYWKLKAPGKQSKWIFILTGLLATLWFLMRVIPKPSRASYPCMKAAAPIMSSFIIYILSLTGSVWAFRKAGQQLRKARYLPFAALAFSGVIALAILIIQKPDTSFANATTLLDANDPVGSPRGSIPGRVTWFWNQDATNAYADITKVDDAYLLPKNTDREVVQEMVDHSILYLTGASTLADAWEELFRYFNRTHGKGEVGYLSGEQIFIKMNLVGQWGLDSTTYDISKGNFKTGHTTPQSVLAILNHLVKVVGVAQKDIALGDPIQQFPQQYYDILQAEYPDVNYISSTGNLGRTRAVTGAESVIFYSDHGSILREGDPDSWVNSDLGDPVTDDPLYTVITEADYMINMANLKGHERAGVSLCAKNHFGSHGRYFAKQLHMGLVHPDQKPNEISRDSYGQYRVLVDLMGHEKLGGNTMLFILDALYSSSGAGNTVVKSKSLGNDWMSSIFMSQDHVAIESVGLDFAREEYQEKYHDKTYPQYTAVEDYLLQAADPAYWPDGFTYDPENDGTPLESLGVYETWNNAKDKLYSGNLGTGQGIELIQVHKELETVGLGSRPAVQMELEVYPNPFTEQLTVGFRLKEAAEVTLVVYDMSGKKVKQKQEYHREGELRMTWTPETGTGELPQGNYVVSVSFLSGGVRQSASALVQFQQD
jgi:hypothetical protein